MCRAEKDDRARKAGEEGQRLGGGEEWAREGCTHPVGGEDNLCLAQVVKPIQLVEQFHECPLNLTVCAGSLAEAPASDGVDLVHKDDARLVFLCVPEHLAHNPGRLSDVLVDDSRRDNLEEVCRQSRGDGPGEERLARSWGTIQQHSCT